MHIPILSSSIDDFNFVTLGAVLSIIGLAYLVLNGEDRLYKGIPSIGVEENAWFKIQKARANWFPNGIKIIERGAQQFAGAYQVVTGIGPKIVLPNRYAHEIRNNPHMSFGRIVTKEFFASYHGFEPFATLECHNILQDTIRTKLTQSLTVVSDSSSKEAADALSDVLGDDTEGISLSTAYGTEGSTMTRNPPIRCRSFNVSERLADEFEEWKEIDLKLVVGLLVARLSTRTFLGTELCRNEEWLHVCHMYTVYSFAGAQALLVWPSILRPIVHWFLPECRRVRELASTGRRLIRPLVDSYRKKARKASEAGQPLPKQSNMIGWIDEVARSRGRPFNIADSQIMLSMAAIHTSTETFSWVLTNLIQHPEYMGLLRQEVINVIGQGGWKKSSLYQMKLMDSFIRESQRMHIMDRLFMNRHVNAEVTLSDGTVIPRNARVVVETDGTMNESIFPNAKTFDGSRFLKMRSQPGQEHRWQIVTTSPEHMAFGHGEHACPGRFYAANSMKLMLAHFVMKYELKFACESPTLGIPFGSTMILNPNIRVLARRRKEEIDF